MPWSEIKGHEAVQAAFERAAQRGRLAHAYLFVGVAGIGKRTFARQLAKTVLCEGERQTWDSCDRCAACKLVDSGTHPDLYTLAMPEDKHEFPMKLITDFIRDFSLKPARGSRKFAIIDDADQFNDESSNAILKTLEEPPPGSVLILIGTSADRQLATIRSRCQVIPFRRLALPLAEAVLTETGLDRANAAHLASISDGSPGLASELSDPIIWETRTHLLREIAQPRARAADTVKRFLDAASEAGKETGAQRRRAMLIIRLVIDGLRAAMTGAITGSSEDSELASLSRFDPDWLDELIERCLECTEQIERRVQLSLAVEAFIAEVTSAPAQSPSLRS
jgi:DNA polymerase-3 subunit delta'